jgi:hypothetical protein
MRNHFVILALVTFGLSVHAEPLLRDLATVQQTPCLDDVVTALNEEIVQASLPMFIKGFARAHRVEATWIPGNAAYEKALSMVREAAQRDQEQHGPWIKISSVDRLELVFRRASIVRQRYIETFLSTAEGKVYWSYLIDGAWCGGLLKGIDQRRPLLTFREQDLLAKRRLLLAQNRRAYDDAINDWNAQQFAEFKTAHEAIDPLFHIEAEDELLVAGALGGSDEDYRSHVRSALESLVPKLELILNEKREP